MRIFADIVLPSYIAVWSLALLGSFAWQCRRMRKARKRRRETARVPIAARCDRKPLSESGIRRVLAAYERDFKRGVYVKEPRRARRRP